jgi:hypothetical protein
MVITAALAADWQSVDTDEGTGCCTEGDLLIPSNATATAAFEVAAMIFASILRGGGSFSVGSGG